MGHLEIIRDSEIADLARLEQGIERGLERAYDNLVEIRDRRLYRATHRTFEDYCLERWGISRRRAYQLIDAAKIAAEIAEQPPDDFVYPGTQIPSQVSEKALRPLAQLPEGTRKEAFKEAKGQSNGHPTAAEVQAVVDKRLGQSQVNGQVVADPPDIARARAAGRIPEGAMVTVNEPAEPTSAEAVREEHAEAAAMSEDALSDEDWLATLPVHSKLEGTRRKRFDTDALDYRRLEPARKTFAHHTGRALKSKPLGAYGWRVKQFLRVEHPRKWVVCPSTENGGCAGTGAVPLLGECPKCRGRGYWLNG